MNSPEAIKLNKIDADDISDALPKIEKSFGFRFVRNELDGISTFGELCDIIGSKIDLESSDDCTTQQAFYKLRLAIASVQSLEKNMITPQSRLETIFPAKNRRRKIRQARKESGFSLRILRPKRWISATLGVILLGSLVTLFINWKPGLIGIALSMTCLRIAKKLGKEFTLKTVGETADQTAREDYIKSRRNPKTVNRLEIDKRIKELFSQDLGIDPSLLTSETRFF